MDKKLFFDALDKALAADSRRVSVNDIQEIHIEIQTDYDHDLHKKLDDFFARECTNRNGVLSMGKVMSTTSFFLAHMIYDGCDTDNEVCILAQAYADYMHQAAHGLFRKHGVSENKKKLG